MVHGNADSAGPERPRRSSRTVDQLESRHAKCRDRPGSDWLVSTSPPSRWTFVGALRRDSLRLSLSRSPEGCWLAQPKLALDSASEGWRPQRGRRHLPQTERTVNGWRPQRALRHLPRRAAWAASRPNSIPTEARCCVGFRFRADYRSLGSGNLRPLLRINSEQHSQHMRKIGESKFEGPVD